MKKQFIFFLLIICISVCFIILLQREKKIKEYFIKENIELAIYLEDEQTNTIPSKESGYYFDREKSNCTNEAYINWDSVSWSPVVNNMNEYKTRCELHFTTTYTEGILNGTDPVLKDELVPVTIEENGTVKKANLESEWYSYEKKEWANSIILDDQYDTLNSQGKVAGATKNDGYVSFDGVDDYIDLGLAGYDFGNQVTFNMKVKINSIKENAAMDLFGNFEGGGLGFVIKASTNTLSFLLRDENKKDVKVGIPITEINTWMTVTGTYDGNTVKIYLNGELQDQLEQNFTISPSELSIMIGASPASGNVGAYFSNIDIAEVQIYNRALDEEEIKEINDGKVANNEGLLRYVDFTNKSYEDNEIIPEEAIESYFVWIPKYRYQLWDLGNYDSLTSIDESKVHEIPIIFGDYNTLDAKEGECTTPMESGKTGNCQVGDYMTHPAFISIPSTGFWVGKFETSRNGGDSDSIRNSDLVQIKPNVSSWRNIQVANAFYTSYDYKRELDSHMMKNTEWGAVAYLQHSAYGSATNVRLNNNSDFLTGYQANNEPTCGYTGTNEECNIYCNDDTCNTTYPSSVLSSTTGNISGIYDMSGGTWEYVMGVMVDENGNPMSGRNSLYNSGFNGTFGCPDCDNDTSGLTELNTGYNFPKSKYYDTYAYATVDEQYQRRILGDATGEMGPFANMAYLDVVRQIGSWYANRSYFVFLNYLWVRRGGGIDTGLDAGVFSFSQEYGRARSWLSYRIILTPTGRSL